jgi:hypothetical protein
MTLEELNLELKKLVGEEVSFKLIFFDTIIIYFFGKPQDKRIVSISICSAWRYQQQGEIICGSHDFYLSRSGFISDKEYQKAFDQMCELTDGLEGARLVDCEVDLDTSDLLMKFSGGQVIRNFAYSGFDEASWTYEKRSRNLTADVSPSGIRLKTQTE